MPAQQYRKISVDDVPANTRRGGDLRTLVSPATAGARGGLFGVVTLGPGEVVGEHYHPYSEETLFVVDGAVTARLDGAAVLLHAGEAVLVPVGVRHRVEHAEGAPARVTFALFGLAPRPDLGHVDTEADYLRGQA
ncbi:cupin domain-containing protein [Dactylosporangium sp. AC04546]|uniref:cupin domain-containing protein n=1 Tax=Dactylosporangium sp. AC04546 TaxID=2862460 RepID=UPI001EDD1B61|nr:cupin domain-containing protein [Dactylosporangium sp. AC04546]WVK79070.1 cupin domain-containing protein [Dactylosporangium sp. AC04546]